jgi:hypothetical protein
MAPERARTQAGSDGRYRCVTRLKMVVVNVSGEPFTDIE